MKPFKDFLIEAKILGSLTLLSGLLGLYRELLIAHRFGATEGTDAFYVAFAIPSLLYAFLVGSGLSFGVIPRLTSKLVADPHRGGKSFAELLSILGFVGLAGSLAILVFARTVVRLFAPGLAASRGAIEFTAWLSPLFFLFVCAYTLAVFQCARDHAARWGWIALLLNLGTVSGVILLSHTWGVTSLAAGAIAGGLFAFVAQAAFAHREGFDEPFQNPLRRSEGARFVAAMLPFALVLGIGGESGTSQADIFLTRYFASRMPHGSVTLLALANKLMGFPVTIIGFTLGVSILPVISATLSRSDFDEAAHSALQALSYALLLVCPVFILFLDMNLPIVRICFGGGALAQTQIAELARILKYFGGALVALTLVSVLGRLLAAFCKTRILVVSGLLIVVLNTLLMIWLSPKMGPRGIAAALSIGSSIYCLVLAIPIVKCFGAVFSLELTKRFLLVGTGGYVMHLVLSAVMRLDFLPSFAILGGAVIPASAGFVAYCLWTFPYQARWRCRQATPGPATR